MRLRKLCIGLVTGLVLVVLSACGGGGGGGTQAPPPASNGNWDSMQWDQANWS